MRVYKEQYACGVLMSLLTRKFTITHPSVVAVATATQIHMPLSSTVLKIDVVNIEVVNRVVCY